MENENKDLNGMNDNPVNTGAEGVNENHNAAIIDLADKENNSDGSSAKSEYNKFDKFFIKLWNGIKKGLNKAADFINGIFEKLFKRKFPARYINAGIVSLLALILILTIGISSSKDPEGSRANLFVYSEDSLFAVQNSDGDWGYVSSKGKEKIPFRFNTATLFVNDRAMVSEVFIINGINVTKFGIINKRGKYINEERYDHATSFDKDGIARVKKDNKFGFVGTNGKMLADGIIYDGAGTFVEGRSWVLIGANYGFIDKKGYIVNPKYSNCWNFSEGLAAVRNTDGKWGFINEDGKEVIKCQFDNIISSFNDGYSIVCFNIKDANGNVTGTKSGIINSKGKFELVAEYKDIDVRVDPVEED